MNWAAFGTTLLVAINITLFFVITWNWVDYISWTYPQYHRTQRNWLLVGVVFWVIEIAIAVGMNTK